MLMNGDNFQAVATFTKSLAFLVSNCDHAILGNNSKHINYSYKCAKLCLPNFVSFGIYCILTLPNSRSRKLLQNFNSVRENELCICLEKNCYERSETVFVRVMSLLGSPLHEKRGIYLLNFLQDYILWKVKVDPIIWEAKITKLLAYLESKSLINISRILFAVTE